MALIYKVLGQTITGGSFSGNALYTVPTGGTAVSSTLSICNLNSSNCTYSIAVVPRGQTLSAKHLIASNTEIKSNETIALSLGITLGSKDSIIVNSANSNLSFNLFGSQSIPTPPPVEVEFLVVAGGGGGGTGNSINDYSGGGGAGGLITASTTFAYDTKYTIEVGSGGLAGAANSNGTNGGNSSIISSAITSVIALGGGYGGAKYTNGGDGGSGGGGGVYSVNTPGSVQPGGSAQQPTSSSGGFGNKGGDGFNYNWDNSGGGGGAGGAGGISGGDGKYLANFSTFGENGYFASGGAGVIGGIGGDSAFKLGGGGGFASNAQWGNSATVPRSAIAATGGGGALGMPGATGIVIIKVPDTFTASFIEGSPTVTTITGYRLYAFTSSGSITF